MPDGKSRHSTVCFWGHPSVNANIRFKQEQIAETDMLPLTERGALFCLDDNIQHWRNLLFWKKLN